jgi:hypothetical protein
MSLLQIITDACHRTNQTPPASAFSSTDLNIQQMVSLAQDIGDELSERYFWRNLNFGGSVTGDASTTEFTLPVDFGQMSPGMTITSSLYPLLPLRGPIDNEDLARLKALPAWPVRPVWRYIGGVIEFFPAPASGEVMTFNYYSANWVLLADATTRAPRWTADTDTALVDEKVLTRGLIWRWLSVKGLEYAEEFRRYEMALDRAVGRDDTARMVPMSRGVNIVDDSWFPGIITYSGP